MKENYWINGIIGVVVGDALGNPVQFMRRNEIKNRPEGAVTGMESGGVYHTPIGTWTDDSSMALATLDSIWELGQVDPEDIMTRFVDWYEYGDYTPFGKAFDMGNTCSEAILRFEWDHNVATCGLRGSRDNGNGSLMRIMPVCLYAAIKQMEGGMTDTEAVGIVEAVSALTHAHLRSRMACGLYYFMVRSLLGKEEKQPVIEVLQEGIDAGLKYYEKTDDKFILLEMSYFKRLFHLSAFAEVAEENIKSSGYVVDTIEAAIWSLITTGSFEECLLKVVNLGDDADTVGAVCGGLAGLYYGYGSVPEEWLSVIPRRDWIEELCRDMAG